MNIDILKLTVSIIGLGYVGLPLAYAFSKKGYKVIGFDINKQRIDQLKNDVDNTLELSSKQLLEIKQNILYTDRLNDIKNANIFIVTVPTPIDKDNKPDLNPLIKSTENIAKVLKKDDIVIYESTVYPGVTEEVCVPLLEDISKLKFNKDFYCGYSPERINPGDKNHTVTKILKVTSGSTPQIAEIIDKLYNSIITAGTFKCSSIRVAEAAKVIENTQRDVNIALVNELALIFDTMGIDTKEVIEAASTKWNFIKLYPGLVGGHCIGVDPYYLTFKAQELGYTPNLILGARQINNSMGKFIAEQTIKYMIQKSITIKGSEILILGMTFKENCPDLRNTRVVDIINELKEYGCNIDIYEPWIKKEDKQNYNYSFVDNPFKSIKKYSAFIIAVAHNQFKIISQNDFNKITYDDKSQVIIDVKGIIDNSTWRL